jgi:hypothetical protein
MKRLYMHQKMANFDIFIYYAFSMKGEHLKVNYLYFSLRIFFLNTFHLKILHYQLKFSAFSNIWRQILSEKGWIDSGSDIFEQRRFRYVRAEDKRKMTEREEGRRDGGPKYKMVAGRGGEMRGVWGRGNGTGRLRKRSICASADFT